MKLTIKDIVRHLAKEEKGLSEVKIGDIREIVAILSDMVYLNPVVISVLLKNGEKRFKRYTK